MNKLLFVSIASFIRRTIAQVALYCGFAKVWGRSPRGRASFDVTAEAGPESAAAEPHGRRPGYV